MTSITPQERDAFATYRTIQRKAGKKKGSAAGKYFFSPEKDIRAYLAAIASRGILPFGCHWVSLGVTPGKTGV